MARTYPDCDVAMEKSEHRTSYEGDGIRVDTDGGILGNVLQLKGKYVGCYVCPACGLVRFYAGS
ncbi:MULTISPECIES: hypothetical protein [unclassified Haladaptatus]|uniref:hypothetical protein n=1 Tax=unclassified Haladaptatus TaxID=2622732 RepID=UPI0023E845FA|nr:MULTISPECIES: hypothetical protein [unclassified Haladaptatus]